MTFRIIALLIVLPLILIIFTFRSVKILRRLGTSPSSKVVIWLSIFLTLLGLSIFLIPFYLPMNGWPSDTTEWPVAWSNQIVATSSGTYAVPIPHLGRIQFYTSEWEFIKATTLGADLDLKATDNYIYAYAKKSDLLYTYDAQGDLLSEIDSEIPLFIPDKGISKKLEAPLWSWILLHPVVGWVLVALSQVLLLVGLTQRHEDGSWESGFSRVKKVVSGKSSASPFDEGAVFKDTFE